MSAGWTLEREKSETTRDEKNASAMGSHAKAHRGSEGPSVTTNAAKRYLRAFGPVKRVARIVPRSPAADEGDRGGVRFGGETQLALREKGEGNVGWDPPFPALDRSSLRTPATWKIAPNHRHFGGIGGRRPRTS